MSCDTIPVVYAKILFSFNENRKHLLLITPYIQHHSSKLFHFLNGSFLTHSFFLTVYSYFTYFLGRQDIGHEQPRFIKIVHPKSLDSDSVTVSENPFHSYASHGRCPF